MNMQSVLENGVDISYKPVVEIPLPDNTNFLSWLAPGLALLGGSKMKNSDKRGVFSAEKGLLADVAYQKVELTVSGLIALSEKKGTKLITRGGVALAGDECDDSRDLGEGFYAKKSRKLWAIFRIDDQAQLTDYLFTEISAFSEGSCVVTTKSGMQIVGADGKPLVPDFYEYAAPFRNGFARVGGRKELNYIDRAGNVLYAGAARGSRDFVNGYAVIRDKSGREGAIDSTGRVVIAPQYRFMKDAENDRFVVSNNGAYQPDGVTFTGRDYGLIAADGRVILPLKYAAVELQPNGSCKFGHMEAWQYQTGNRIFRFGVLVFGVADANGGTLLPEKYVAVGQPSEGMCAYKTFEEKTLRFGYMAEDGSSSFEIGAIDYAHVNDMERTLLREDISLQLSPFRNGRANVCIRNVDTSVGIFKKTTEQHAGKVGWYEIGKDGRELDAKQSLSLTKANILSNQELPFFHSYRQLEANTFVNAAMLESAVNIHPFEDMCEVDYAFGFAILDRDMHCICANDDGLPSQPYAYIYLSRGTHERYVQLFRVAKNVWQATNEQGRQSILFSEFESPTRFSSGLAVFRKLADKGRFVCGYMDSCGRTVIEPKYTQADGFSNGYALASDGDKHYLLYREAVVTEAAPQ